MWPGGKKWLETAMIRVYLYVTGTRPVVWTEDVDSECMNGPAVACGFSGRY